MIVTLILHESYPPHTPHTCTTLGDVAFENEGGVEISAVSLAAPCDVMQVLYTDFIQGLVPKLADIQETLEALHHKELLEPVDHSQKSGDSVSIHHDCT